ncbi:hypothetical protein B0F90DRAFT_461354 [Multifurca ochricompacta]|uniref:Uncharacterized protein n=1 Tax=Multifurca ochricompacta TaxID=376703 RepID=A0AAD4M2Z1_9AGAM|nr:hypothetical protein B0F90DRAFT_461354 [Multifurca ochricompacta]
MLLARSRTARVYVAAGICSNPYICSSFLLQTERRGLVWVEMRYGRGTLPVRSPLQRSAGCSQRVVLVVGWGSGLMASCERSSWIISPTPTKFSFLFLYIYLFLLMYIFERHVIMSWSTVITH